MNVFLVVLAAMLLVNAALALVLALDVLRTKRAARHGSGLSVVAGEGPAALTPPVRPALMLVK